MDFSIRDAFADPIAVCDLTASTAETSDHHRMTKCERRKSIEKGLEQVDKILSVIFRSKKNRMTK